MVNVLSPLDTIDFCLVRLNSNSTNANDTALATSAAYEASLETSNSNASTSEIPWWNVSNASTLDKSLLLPSHLVHENTTHLDLSLCVNHTVRLRSALSARHPGLTNSNIKYK